MPTLVLSPRYTPDSIALWGAAIAAGWDVHRAHSMRPPEALSLDEPVFSDEPLMATLWASALGVALLEPPLDWLATLPPRHVKRAVRFMTLSEARLVEGRVFIKPADDKCFAARVYEGGAALPALAHLPPSTPTLVSEPVRFRIELRAFVADRRVHALSAYVRDGDLARDASGAWVATDDELARGTAALEALLADSEATIPPACVIDVGEIEGRGFAVVEANPAWGAGICGCDPGSVLGVLRRACRPLACLTDEERRFTVDRPTVIDG